MKSGETITLYLSEGGRKGGKEGGRDRCTYLVGRHWRLGS